MERLILLAYCSTATRDVDRDVLNDILRVARAKNAREEITGMLLYAKGSFFQVLEGSETAIDNLFSVIEKDHRHSHLTVVIREPIAARSFGDWTMGFADITPQEAASIVGANQFFTSGDSPPIFGEGRARKLLAAFKQGRWRTRIKSAPVAERAAGACPDAFPPADATEPLVGGSYSFAFQPIVHARAERICSYEALLRGPNRESAAEILGQLTAADLPAFDAQSRAVALHLAASLGITTRINLNVIPSTILRTPTFIEDLLAAAERVHMPPEQIVVEVLESELIEDVTRFSSALCASRSSGLLFAIDDFGAGHAGLNLLAEFQPEQVKLDMELVRGVDHKGPRQAIIRGMLRTCFELGIDVIAEGVETADEFNWLQGEGVDLFQGHYFVKPAFEELPTWP